MPAQPQVTHACAPDSHAGGQKPDRDRGYKAGLLIFRAIAAVRAMRNFRRFCRKPTGAAMLKSAATCCPSSRTAAPDGNCRRVRWAGPIWISWSGKISPPKRWWRLPGVGKRTLPPHVALFRRPDARMHDVRHW